MWEGWRREASPYPDQSTFKSRSQGPGIITSPNAVLELLEDTKNTIITTTMKKHPAEDLVKYLVLR